MNSAHCVTERHGTFLWRELRFWCLQYEAFCASQSPCRKQWHQMTFNHRHSCNKKVLLCCSPERLYLPARFSRSGPCWVVLRSSWELINSLSRQRNLQGGKKLIFELLIISSIYWSFSCLKVAKLFNAAPNFSPGQTAFTIATARVSYILKAFRTSFTLWDSSQVEIEQLLPLNWNSKNQSVKLFLAIGRLEVSGRTAEQ